MTYKICHVGLYEFLFSESGGGGHLREIRVDKEMDIYPRPDAMNCNDNTIENKFARRIADMIRNDVHISKMFANKTFIVKRLKLTSYIIREQNPVAMRGDIPRAIGMIEKERKEADAKKKAEKAEAAKIEREERLLLKKLMEKYGIRGEV